MSHISTLNIFENKICIRCGATAVGRFSDGWATRYYCQYHFSKLKDLWSTAKLLEGHERARLYRDYKTLKRVSIIQQSLFAVPI